MLETSGNPQLIISVTTCLCDLLERAAGSLIKLDLTSPENDLQEQKFSPRWIVAGDPGADSKTGAL